MRLLIVDDSPAVRTVLRIVLSQDGHDVVGEAADGRQAIGEAAAHQPDVVILDDLMPGMGGLAAAPEIHRVAPDARLVLFSSHEEVGDNHRARDAGIHRVVDKLSGPDALSAALGA